MVTSLLSAVLLAVLSTTSAALAPRQQAVHLAVSPSCGTKDFNHGLGPLSSFDTIVAFGDEYTDGGAHDGGTLPPAVVVPPNPRAGGRRSNGPVWVEYLADKAGATLKDFAVDGAVISKGQWPGSVADVNDYEQQYLEYTGTGRDNVDTTLYVIFFGINDYEKAVETGEPLTRQSEWLAYDTVRLISSPVFGRNFLVVDNYGRGSSTSLGEAYKAEVIAGLQSIAGTFDLNVAFADLSTIWNGVLDSPGHAAFGYTNPGACTVDDTTTVGACSDPEHSFYWMPGAPSTATHKIIADYVEQVLETCA